MPRFSFDRPDFPTGSTEPNTSLPVPTGAIELQRRVPIVIRRLS